jgi:hypothetical protein
MPPPVAVLPLPLPEASLRMWAFTHAWRAWRQQGGFSWLLAVAADGAVDDSQRASTKSQIENAAANGVGIGCLVVAESAHCGANWKSTNCSIPDAQSAAPPLASASNPIPGQYHRDTRVGRHQPRHKLQP